MSKQAKKSTGNLPVTPQKTKNGVKVHYDAHTEAFYRQEAQRLGFRNVQEYLKFKGRRERMAAQGRDD